MSNCLFIVDGHWGRWLPWEECSATCDGGQKVRRRLCDSPRQQYGGKSCEGDATEVMDCNLRPCAGKDAIKLVDYLNSCMLGNFSCICCCLLSHFSYLTF